MEVKLIEETSNKLFRKLLLSDSIVTPTRTLVAKENIRSPAIILRFINLLDRKDQQVRKLGDRLEAIIPLLNEHLEKDRNDVEIIIFNLIHKNRLHELLDPKELDVLNNIEHKDRLLIGLNISKGIIDDVPLESLFNDIIYPFYNIVTENIGFSTGNILLPVLFPRGYLKAKAWKIIGRYIEDNVDLGGIIVNLSYINIFTVDESSRRPKVNKNYLETLHNILNRRIKIEENLGREVIAIGVNTLPRSRGNIAVAQDLLLAFSGLDVVGPNLMGGGGNSRYIKVIDIDRYLYLKCRNVDDFNQIRASHFPKTLEEIKRMLNAGRYYEAAKKAKLYNSETIYKELLNITQLSIDKIREFLRMKINRVILNYLALFSG